MAGFVLGSISLGVVDVHAHPAGPYNAASLNSGALSVTAMPYKAQPSQLPLRRAMIQWAEQRISSSEAKAIALSRVPDAEVIDVKLEGDVYKVRLLRKDGRVVDVLIDAMTGSVR